MICSPIKGPYVRLSCLLGRLCIRLVENTLLGFPPWQLGESSGLCIDCGQYPDNACGAVESRGGGSGYNSIVSSTVLPLAHPMPTFRTTYRAHSQINRRARQPAHIIQVKVKLRQIKCIPQPRELYATGLRIFRICRRRKRCGSLPRR
jgi:hypothetical protein